jgi:ribosomal protein S18 acetylase RimI-like enzyme
MAGRAARNPAPRLATAGDAPALNRLARSAYAVYVPLIGREPMPMAVDWATLLAGQEIWIIDGPSGDIAGSLALEVGADHVMIWSVAVAPALQRRGLGRALMAFAETRACALGRPELRLFTNLRMERNVALYRRLGYVETRHEPLPDRVLVHMRKPLDVS